MCTIASERTRPRRHRLIVLGVLLVSAPAVLDAQPRGPVLSVTPPDAPTAGATVVASNLFAQGEVRDLVRAGFPALIRFRVELWRAGGLFEDLESHDEWELIVQYDPSQQRYGVIRQQGSRREEAGSFATLTTAQAVIERPVKTALVPERAGTRYYYFFSVDIEALSVTDMDKLEEWLRGVREGNPATAVGSGLRTLMLRLLGTGEKHHYTTRSGYFVAER